MCNYIRIYINIYTYISNINAHNSENPSKKDLTAIPFFCWWLNPQNQRVSGDDALRYFLEIVGNPQLLKHTGQAYLPIIPDSN